MRKYFLTHMLLLFAAMSLTSCHHFQAQASKAHRVDEVTRIPLLKTRTTWDGYPISYPQTRDPEVTMGEIVIPPNYQLDFHCHPFPLFGYVLAGYIEVESLTGQRQRFEQGEAVAEVRKRWHRGITGPEGARIVTIDLGTVGQTNVIAYSEATAAQCRD